MGVHDGHRERLKAQFSEYGLESFNDINTLELLLFFAVPRKDTNMLAHRLLDRFGSLDAVFEASERELLDVSGVGENVARLICLVPQITKKCQVLKTKAIKQICNSTDAGEYLLPRFMNEKDEIVLVMFLDAKKCVISCLEIGRGNANCVDVSIRKIVEMALKTKCSSAILAHNHPDGIALPSKEDDYFTRRLCNALNLVGIELNDHIIVSDGEYVSFADSGLMSLYYC